MELHRSAGVERGRGVRNRIAAAGGVDTAGWQLGGIRDGVCAARRRYHLESRNVVVWTAVIEFAYIDRFDYRSRHCEPVDGSKDRNERGGLGAGGEHRQVVAAVTGGRLRRCVFVADSVQGADSEQAALRCAERNRTAAILDSFATGADVYGRELRAWIERRAKRNGIDHAHSDWNGADCLCNESCGDV